MNDLDCPNKLEPEKNYDTIMAYCQSCKERIDIPVMHDGATNTQFQLVNVPVGVFDNLDQYKADCKNCGNTNIIEKQTRVTNFEVFTVKLDCSNMSLGMDSWYENNSSISGDGHPRKF